MSGPTIIEIDHLAYLTRRPYRRQVHLQLRQVRRGQLSHLVVLHEADGSCCRRQEWSLTAIRLLTELEADGGLVG